MSQLQCSKKRTCLPPLAVPSGCLSTWPRCHECARLQAFSAATVAPGDAPVGLVPAAHKSACWPVTWTSAAPAFFDNVLRHRHSPMHLLVVAQQREQVLYHSVTTSTEKMVHRSASIRCLPIHSVKAGGMDSASSFCDIQSICMPSFHAAIPGNFRPSRFELPPG